MVPELSAQLELDIPDSTYVPNQLIVWFEDGTLNKEYLGGYGEMDDYPYSDEGMAALPVTGDCIQSLPLSGYLQSRGVKSMLKVVPWIDPYRDTLSITRRGDTVRVAPWWNVMLLEFDPGFEANMVYEAYMLLSLHYGAVRWAEPNFVFQTGFNPKGIGGDDEGSLLKSTQVSDPRWSNQISLHNESRGIYIESAWNYNHSDTTVRIAIIDDGVYKSNPDFNGKLAVVKKYVTNGAGTGTHGTDMAGIIGARKDNVGVAGIAGGEGTLPGSPLYILDVVDRNRAMTHATVADALVEASYSTTSRKGFGCHIANLSLYGALNDPFLRQAVVTAYAQGLRVNACMGNTANTTPQYPAGTDEHYILAVGAKYHNYSRHIAGSYGSHMDLMAPGYGTVQDDPLIQPVHIVTTRGNGTGYSGGETSAATAHCTGVAALLITEYLNSGWNVDQPHHPEDIENLLEAGCVDGNGQVRGTHDDETGWGFLHAANSLSYLSAPYILRHYSGTLTLESLPTPTLIPGHVRFEDIHHSLPDITLLDPQQYKITTRLNYPAAYVSVIRSWGIGNNHSGSEGLAAARHWPGTTPWNESVYQLGFTEVDWYDSRSCDVATYFFYGADVFNGGYTWVPFDPTSKDIHFHYSVLGIPGIIGVEDDHMTVPNDIGIVSAYPNPIQSSSPEVLHIEFNCAREAGPLYLILADVLGRIVRAQSIPDVGASLNRVTVNTRHLPSGMYLVTLFSGNSISTKTVSILH